MKISLIAAIGKNNELGGKNALLWKLPADVKYFKYMTSGHNVIMGKRTFDSIGHPLPNRRNIVLTKEKDFKPEGVDIVYSPEELEKLLERISDKNEENFVIGGAQIYKLLMDKADKLYITHIDAEFPEADTFFPPIDKKMWEEISEEKHTPDEQNKYAYSFVEYIRK